MGETAALGTRPEGALGDAAGGQARYLVPERLLGKVPRTLGLEEGMSPPGAQRGGAAEK